MASSIDVTKPEEGAATTQSVRDNFAAAKAEIEELQDFSVLLNIIYPVGSIYTTLINDNPEDIIGIGTWSRFAAGRFLAGYSASNAKFDAIEETGGAEEVTLDVTMIPSHTHIQNAHTHASTAYEIPAAGTGGNIAYSRNSSFTPQVITPGNANTTAINQNTGGGLAHQNLPPYIVVYIWERTA